MTGFVHYRCGAGLTKAVLILLILIVLGLIGIPGVRRAQARQTREELSRDYMQVMMAKEAWAVSRNLPPGSPVTMDELTSHGKALTRAPEWPANTKFELGAIGTTPTLVWNGEKIDPLLEARTHPLVLDDEGQ